MTIAIMIRKSIKFNLRQLNQSLQTKVIKVSKKKVNGTIFIIFEEENEKYPMYRIINDCSNVKISFY